MSVVLISSCLVQRTGVEQIPDHLRTPGERRAVRYRLNAPFFVRLLVLMLRVLFFGVIGDANGDSAAGSA